MQMVAFLAIVGCQYCRLWEIVAVGVAMYSNYYEYKGHAGNYKMLEYL